METSNEKEVYFDQYCGTCKHADDAESEDCCDDCLSMPSNTDSHKPVKWEEK